MQYSKVLPTHAAGGAGGGGGGSSGRGGKRVAAGGNRGDDDPEVGKPTTVLPADPFPLLVMFVLPIDGICVCVCVCAHASVTRS